MKSRNPLNSARYTPAEIRRTAALRYSVPITKAEELELFPKIRAGDADALERIVNNYLLMAYKSARQNKPAMLSDDLCNSVAHDALLLAARKYDEHHGNGFSSFLMVVVANQIRNMWRKERRIMDVDQLVEGGLGPVTTEIDMDHVHWRDVLHSLPASALGEAWGRLNDREKRIVRAVVLEERSQNDPKVLELAARDGRPPVTRQRVRQLLENAMAKLRSCLAEHGVTNVHAFA